MRLFYELLCFITLRRYESLKVLLSEELSVTFNVNIYKYGDLGVGWGLRGLSILKMKNYMLFGKSSSLKMPFFER